MTIISAVVRVVREPAVAAGDRAGRDGRRDGAVPGHAHVHHLRAPEDGHEGRGAATRPRPPPQKGTVKSCQHWLFLFAPLSAVIINVVKGYLSVILVLATFDHVYLHSRV